MKDLLEYIIPNIVNHPEDVKIEETSNDGLVNVTIQTHAEDVGRVIGKSGKVIKAIRQIARVVAIKQGVRVNIDVLDSGLDTRPTPKPMDDSNADSAQTPETTEVPVEQAASPNSDTSSDLDQGIDLQTE